MERQTALVVDASVAVKWFVPEVDSQAALGIRDAHANQEISLFAPDLLGYEVANALHHRSGLNNDDLEEGIKALFELDLTLIAPTTRSISRAARLARTMDLTIYDSTYLALAEDLNCQLVTSDKTFYDKLFTRAEKSASVVLLKDYSAEQQRAKDRDSG